MHTLITLLSNIVNLKILYNPLLNIPPMLSTMFPKTLLVVESGISLMAERPWPANFPTRGSMGKVPKNGSLAISAKERPPPLENMFVQWLHVGHS